MSATNLIAFTSYCQDDTLAGIILSSKGIDPTATDKNELSMAYGMLEKAKGSDYSQARTSEKLSASSRKLLIESAKSILMKYGVSEIDIFEINVSGIAW